MSGPTVSIAVRPTDRLKWQRLLTEAIKRGLVDTIIGQAPAIGPAYVHGYVTSHSQPDTSHEVEITRDQRGDVSATCDCKAGETLTACTHIALAVDSAGMWPIGMVIARQAMLPNPETRWEFRITEWVLIRGTSRRGVVAGISVHEGRPFYRVDDPDSHTPLGHYFSYELVPTAKPRHKLKVEPSAAMAVLTKGGGA